MDSYIQTDVSLFGIMLKGRYVFGVQELNILNCYGPYHHRIPFWSQIRAAGILQKSGLIIGGDLNFTLSADENWVRVRLDRMLAFFIIFSGMKAFQMLFHLSFDPLGRMVGVDWMVLVSV